MSRRLGLVRAPLLDRPLPPDAVPRPFGLVAPLGVAFYGVAAVRYAELHRHDAKRVAEVVIGPTTRESVRDHATVVPSEPRS